MGEGGANGAGSGLGLVAGLLMVVAVGALVGAAGLRWVQGLDSASERAASAPVIILSVADLVRGGKDALEIRALAKRLADGGFLVLDAQAVLAAPPGLYLQAGQGPKP